jgi:hypothetical protein
MHRRGFVKALVAVPAAPALIAQQTGPAQPAPGIPLNPTLPIQPPRSAAMELPKLDPSVPDEAAEMMPHFFTPLQFAALRKVCDIIMPAVDGKPGALAAKAPEFLDFLVGESLADRKDVYRTGLDALNGHAKKRFNKAFSDVDASQADELLASLREPWTYEVPPEPVARFLRVAKVEVRTATANSREYMKAQSGAGGERRIGGGLYWYPLD